MDIQTFNTIMWAWNVIFFITLTFCSVNAILSVRKQNKKFILSYVPEGITVLINLVFMYLIDKDYIDYGNDKFSGLNAMGDWLGFMILIIITAVPLIITLVCNVIYVVKKRKMQ